ncbi:MAG: N-acetylmuramoyl-L-alanine amidase [Pseudomonadota bacterium]
MKLLRQRISVVMFGKFAAFMVVLTVLVAWSAVSQAQSVRIDKARIGVQNKSTLRFVLESSARLKPTVSYLKDPNRIVIDLPPVTFALGPGITEGTRFIESYRYGAFSNSVSRLVIDLKKPARVKRDFSIKPSKKNPAHRYVFDIALTSDARFAKEVARTAQQLADPNRNSVEPVLSAAARNGDKPVIAIDAGHGGNDPGTMGVNGKAEKKIALSVARQLYASLKATGQFTPIMTRNRDIYVDLRRRVEIARTNEADLMLSLHADSIGNKTLKGGTIYTLSEKASDEEAATLAAKENKADIIAGIDLDMENPFVRDILITLAQRESKNFSVKFANVLIDEMGGRRLIPKRPHRYAGFVVLKAPDVPSVLVEMGYLSNAQDAARLSSKQGQADIVRALTEAIETYFAQLDIN